MRYLALATDYDGTLAASGRVSSQTESALRNLTRSGRRLLLLTGRTLEELAKDCPNLGLFDCIVLENGGVLYVPASRQSIVLCAPTALALIPRLQELGVEPVIQGRALVASRRPHEIAILESVRDLELELQIIFNQDAVMVLPSGVNKGSGLRAALRFMGLSVHEVVGIGNAANDHSFLEICECAVAVDNAVESLKRSVDFCTRAAADEGVRELIVELVASDLSERSPGGGGDVIALGSRHAETVTFPPYGQNILISGPSSAGKSSFATGLIERLIERSYQVCIIDPEGDYGTLEQIVTVGSRLRAPTADDVLERLEDVEANVVVNLLGLQLGKRPDFFGQLFPRLQAMRSRTGRPHWVVIDEVHHLLPGPWGHAPSTLPQRLGETILITHQPREVAPSILALVDVVVAVGPSPAATLSEFADALGIAVPPISSRPIQMNEVIIWQRTAGLAPCPAEVIPARSERLRHLRKYAEGNLGPKSFVFRGPKAQLKLRAVNLVMFCDLAAGVDEDTWLYHLRRGDYARWFSEIIKDDDLAREVSTIASASGLPPVTSRRLVRDAVDRRYMLPR
jgi:HAD superfamily hydrolase (TIGR01484 family)